MLVTVVFLEKPVQGAYQTNKKEFAEKSMKMSDQTPRLLWGTNRANMTTQLPVKLKNRFEILCDTYHMASDTDKYKKNANANNDTDLFHNTP